jgi:hypothetical protein
MGGGGDPVTWLVLSFNVTLCHSLYINMYIYIYSVWNPGISEITYVYSHLKLIVHFFIDIILIVPKNLYIMYFSVVMIRDVVLLETF